MQTYRHALRFILASILVISAIIPVAALSAQTQKFYIDKATKEYQDGNFTKFLQTCKAWEIEHPGFPPSFYVAYALYRLGQGRQAEKHISEIESKITMSTQQLKKLSLLKKEVSYFRISVATKKEGTIVMKRGDPACYDGCTEETEKEKIAKKKRVKNALGRNLIGVPKVCCLSQMNSTSILSKRTPEGSALDTRHFKLTKSDFGVASVKFTNQVQMPQM